MYPSVFSCASTMYDYCMWFNRGIVNAHLFSLFVHIDLTHEVLLCRKNYNCCQFFWVGFPVKKTWMCNCVWMCTHFNIIVDVTEIKNIQINSVALLVMYYMSALYLTNHINQNINETFFERSNPKLRKYFPNINHRKSSFSSETRDPM